MRSCEIGSQHVLESAAKLAARGVWLSWALVVALVSIGIPLAVVGWFVPSLVVPATLLLGAFLYRLIGNTTGLESLRGRSASLLFLVALAIVSISTIANLAYAGQHHATHRDPGVYLETGLSLAESGSVIVDGRQGPFLALAELEGGGLGFSEIDDGTGRLYPQFGHATAVVIAAGSWVAGEAGATRVPALLTALALVLWWFAIRVVTSPGWATIGVAALSLNLAVVHVSRDTFSEPLAFALLAGAAVLLTRPSRAGRWLLAGWAIGISVSARVDMMVVVFGAMVLAAILIRGRPRQILAFIAATIAAAGVSFIDLALRSPEYLSDRWPALLPVIVASFAAAVVAISSLSLVRDRPRMGTLPLLVAARPIAKWLGVIGVVVVAGYALILRPHLVEQHSGFSGHIAGLQARDGFAVDGTRTYGEQAAVWLTWYLGIPAVLLAVAGAATTWARFVDRRSSALLPAVALMAPLTILYLQRPRITGDQIWAMRRFVPTGIPLTILLAVVAGFRFVAWLKPRVGNRGASFALATLGLSIVAPAAAVTWPLRSERTMLWPTYAISELCDVIAPDSAVLISNDQLLGDHMIRTVARTCQVPTARADLSEIDLAGLSSQWRTEGRDLLVIAYSGEQISGASPLSDIEMPQQLLEQAIERRPDHIESGTRRMTIWTATPNTGQ